jgi:hypothetical protein
MPSLNMASIPVKLHPADQAGLTTTANGILPLSLTNTQSEEALVSSRLPEEEIAGTEGFFGFSTTPGPWADCFANLLPDSDWMPSNGCMCHDPVTSRRRGVLLTYAKVSNMTYSYGNSQHPPEKVSEQLLFPVSHNDQRRQNQPNATANQQEVVWHLVSLIID